jgi:hypothetical protein
VISAFSKQHSWDKGEAGVIAVKVSTHEAETGDDSDESVSTHPGEPCFDVEMVWGHNSPHFAVAVLDNSGRATSLVSLNKGNVKVAGRKLQLIVN